MMVDDDPSHLQLYSWIIERGGFAVHGVLAANTLARTPLVASDLTVLDYRLGPLRAIDVAHRVLELSPGKPIVLLSDVQWLPDEFVPLDVRFIRKGEPQQLIDTIAELLKT